MTHLKALTKVARLACCISLASICQLTRPTLAQDYCYVTGAPEAYASSVRKEIAKHWHSPAQSDYKLGGGLPLDLAEQLPMPPQPGRVTTIALRLNRSGGVVSVASVLDTKYGAVAEIDAAALRAVRACKFAPVPQGLPAPLTLRVSFEAPDRERLSGRIVSGR